MLGIEPVGLPKGGTIPSYLSKYRDAKYTNVGSLTEPNLKPYIPLRPDLIIISGRQQTYYESFPKSPRPSTSLWTRPITWNRSRPTPGCWAGSSAAG